MTTALEGSVAVERVVGADRLIGGVPLLEPLEQSEDLERRADLEVSIGRVVRHGFAALNAVRRVLGHGQDAARARVQRDKRIVKAGGIADGNCVCQRGEGGVLHRGIHRGADRDALSLKHALALGAGLTEGGVLQELSQDVVAEIGLGGFRAGATFRGNGWVQHRVDGRVDALVILFLRDDVLLEHSG